MFQEHKSCIHLAKDLYIWWYNWDFDQIFWVCIIQTDLSWGWTPFWIIASAFESSRDLVFDFPFFALCYPQLRSFTKFSLLRKFFIQNFQTQNHPGHFRARTIFFWLMSLKKENLFSFHLAWKQLHWIDSKWDSFSNIDKLIPYWQNFILLTFLN